MSTQPSNKGRSVIVGCLVVLGVVLIGGGAAAYFLFGRPAISAFNAARDLGRIQQLEGRVSNRSSFRSPVDGVLSADQVERYLSVARQVAVRIEDRMTVLEARYRDVSSTGASFAGFRQAASAWADLLRLVVEAKEAQVTALNDQGFSLSEYGWVRGQVMGAAGLSLFQVDLAALLENDEDPTVGQQPAAAPAANVELVAPYTQELERLLPLAVFGL